MASKDNQDPGKDIQQEDQLAGGPLQEESGVEQAGETAGKDASSEPAQGADPVENKQPDAKAAALETEKESDFVEGSVAKAAGGENLVRGYVVSLIVLAVIGGVGYSVWQHYQKAKRVSGQLPENMASKIQKPAHLSRLKSDVADEIKDKQYAELLLKRESMNAEKAERSGRSNIPSILSAKVAVNDFGHTYGPLKTGDPKSGEKKQDEAKGFAGITPDCNEDALKNARKSGVTADELRCKGCDAAGLRKAGYSAGSLHAAGYSAASMKKAGYNLADLASAGYGLDQLKAAGFPLLGKSGIQALSPTVQDLIKAGFSAKDLKAMGLMDPAIRGICLSATSLLKAGYTVLDLLKLGYLPIELHQSGVSVNALENAGVSQKALKSAGLVPKHYAKCKPGVVMAGHKKGVKASEWVAKSCSPAVMKQGGYSLGELLDAGISIPEIVELDFSGKALAEAGVSVLALREAGVPIKRLKVRYGYNLSALKKAGYFACDLKAAGVDATSLHLAGFDAKDLLQAGFGLDKLKSIGFSVGDAMGAGAKVQDLLDAGYSLKDLKNAGVSAEALHKAGISASDAKKAGYDLGSLHLADYGYGDLIRAGFSGDDLRRAGIEFGAKRECAKDYVRTQRRQGVSLTFFKEKGCSAKSLKDGGYEWEQLKKVGFLPHTLLKAGISMPELKSLFTDKELQDDGVVTDKDLHDSSRLSCDTDSIKKAVKEGVPARSFMLKGCGPAKLKVGGYTVHDLKHAGFSPRALKDAGFSDDDIKAAGYDDDQLQTVGLGSKNLDPALESQIQDGKKPSTKEAQLRAQLEDQYAQLNDQQKEQMSKKLQGSMKSAANRLMTSWEKPNAMKWRGMKAADVENVLHAGGRYADGETSGKKHKGEKITYHQSTQTRGKSPKSSLIKAGSISYAVIDNQVSSDAKTPVLATVVEGPLQGSKLIGSFTNNDATVTIRFSKISVPWRDQSASISVLAIDPDTAESALASSVDHHYWKKYGVLFAASFIQGMGTAVNNASTTVSSNIGTYTFQTSGLTIGEKVLSALGQVGTNIGSDIQSISSAVKTTVIVDPGTSIGLLFTDDYQIPQ